jgi:hypothetical protein
MLLLFKKEHLRDKGGRKTALIAEEICEYQVDYKGLVGLAL